VSATASSTLPALSLIFPARNEERRLGRALDASMAYLGRRGVAYEIIVVDDGSDDGTRRIAEERAREDRAVRMVTLPVNRGKGAAVKAGLLRATGRWRLVSDVDLSTPIEELERLEAHCAAADVIIGSRALSGSELGLRQPASREWLGRSFNLAVRAVGLSDCRDTQCGFKLWSAEAAEAVFPHLSIERFAFDVESLWLARAAGCRIAEVPVRWNHDAATTVRVGADGVRMLVDLARIVLRSRVYQPPAVRRGSELAPVSSHAAPQARAADRP
jgi:dolichyl-phosphate beta-glucosyltransferase